MWTRASTRRRPAAAGRRQRRHPSARRLATATVVATGFFAVPTASGMSVTDFAELVGVAIVLREIVQFALGFTGGGSDPPDSGEGPDAG